MPLKDKNDNDEADIETELQDPGVERAEEKQPEVESATEGKPEDLLVGETGFQSEGTEQEGDTDEDEESEAEGDTQRIHVHPQALDHQVCDVEKIFTCL